MVRPSSNSRERQHQPCVWPHCRYGHNHTLQHDAAHKLMPTRHKQRGVAGFQCSAVHGTVRQAAQQGVSLRHASSVAPCHCSRYPITILQSSSERPIGRAAADCPALE